MLARAILLSVRQLAHPATLRLVLIVVVLTALIFAVFGALLWLLLDRWLLPQWFGADSNTAAGSALIITLFLGWFLFRAVAMAVMGLFTDRIVASVEEDDYPAAAARAVPVPFRRGLMMGLRSARRALGWNLLAAPFYLGLLITGVGTLALALVINAALLGRDLEMMVAARHPDALPMPATRRWGLGFATAALFVVPFINLLAPLFGAALAVHLFHLKPNSPQPEAPAL